MERAVPPFHILLIEDNQGDVDLVLDALSNCSIPHRVSLAPDGTQALADLHEFFAAIRAIADFWLKVAKLPPRVLS